MDLYTPLVFGRGGLGITTLNQNTALPGTPYVLVTPVRDEEATIGATIQSVLAQSVLPREWVIVSDGSTDRTDEIVNSFAASHPFIRLLPLDHRPARNFASVVFATESGCRALRCRNCDYLGLLDGDVRLPRDYYEQILARFGADSSLGMAGGVVVDIGTKGECPRNLNDIPGAVQFFRRDCFQSLGGVIAVAEGGWDALTCAKARMNGYRTRLFPELVVEHLKPRNLFLGSDLRRRWHMGVRDYALGYHPLFELVKCLGRISEERPWLLGAGAWFFGYSVAALSGRPSSLPSDLRQFIRREQLGRLLAGLRLRSS